MLGTICQDQAVSQTYNDGPIELRAKVRDIELTFSNSSDATLSFGGTVGFDPDEYTFKLWARDNSDVDGIGWGSGTGCLTENFNPPQPSQDFNLVFYNNTYTGTTVPEYLDLRVDFWEDEGNNDNVAGIGNCDGNRCTFEGGGICCGEKLFGACIGVTDEEDDRRCNGNPFETQLDYRQGPPCQWHDYGGPIEGNCSNYDPNIETYWRYTKGDSCSNPIPLGTINPGDTVSHFNSNECYTNDFTQQPGNDVFYSFNVNSPVALNMSLCGNASFDTYMYLLDDNCVIDTFNNDFCSNISQIQKSICEAGTYKLVVDGNTASAMGTFTLTIEEDPSFSFQVNAQGTDISCNGADDGKASVNPLGGTSPFNFNWSTNDSTQTIDSLKTGSYSVTVTDATGCQATDSVTIDEPSPITATLSKTDVTCSGANDGTATVNVNGGTKPYSYEWSTVPTQSGDSAIFLGPGIYTVTVTDANGCEITESITVNTNTKIDIDVQQQKDVSCKGIMDGSIAVSTNGGNPPYDYIWSNGDSTGNISNLGPGNYTVTVFDQDQCNQDTSLAISQPDSLVLSLEKIENVDCLGDETGAIDISTTGGTTPYSYTWSNGSKSEDQIGIAVDTYAVTVTDANGCTDTLGNLKVEGLSDLSTTISGTNPSCYNASDGSVKVTVTGGQRPYDYFWSNFSGDSTLDNAEAGSYLVVIQDDLGCQITDSITLSEPNQITTNFSVNTISCQGEDDGSINVSTSGGNAPFDYVWSNGDSSANNTNLTAGNYGVTVSDQNQCSKDTSLTVEEPDALSISLENIDNVACEGDENGVIDISTTGGTPPYSYNWSNGSQDEDQSGLAADTYAVTLTDNNGCKDTLSNLTVEQLSDMSTSISGTNPSCSNTNDGSIEVIVSGGQPPYDYFWSDFSGDSIIENADDGSYLVVIQDEQGCQITDSITLSEPGRVTTDFSVKGISCKGEADGAISATAVGGTPPFSYKWSNGARGDKIDTLGPGNYGVTVTDANNCLDTSSVILESATEECAVDTQENKTFTVAVPNAFTPNNDGLNDELKIQHNGSFDQFTFQVFNRWGELVFETNDPTATWDGTRNGDKLPSGVYVYHLKGTLLDDSEIEKQGSITLIR